MLMSNNGMILYQICKDLERPPYTKQTIACINTTLWKGVLSFDAFDIPRINIVEPKNNY